MSEYEPADYWIEQLESPDSTERLAAVRALAQLETSDRSIIQAIEHTVVSDDDPAVRRAALEALSAPAHERVQWQRFKQSPNPISPSRMRFEIDEWASAGLIPAETTELLKRRYPERAPIEPLISRQEPPPAPGPADEPDTPAHPQSQQPTLSQVLLSEASIKIALYLGAFFVVAAGFITAALVEVARLPILSVVTFLLLGGSLALLRRLPMAGFVLYAAGGLMIPIDAGVLADISNITQPQNGLFWCITFALSSVVWMAGTWRMRSRLFSLLAFIASTLAAIYLVVWLEAESPSLLLGLVTLVGLVGAWVLREWGGSKLFWPLFVAAHIQQVVLIILASGTALTMLFDLSSIHNNRTWLDVAGFWLVSALFYAASDWLIPPIQANSRDDPKIEFGIFQPAAVFCLGVAPLAALQALQPTPGTFAATVWIWGALLALIGEALYMPGSNRLRSYGFFCLIASVPLLAWGILITESVELRIGYLTGAAILYTGLALWKLRWPIWSLAVIAWTAAYLTVFSLPAIESLDLFAGYILIVPMAVYLMFDLFGRKRFSLPSGWTLPVLVMGILLALVAGFVTLFSFSRQPGSVALTYLLMAAFLTLYALLDSQVVFWIGALLTAYLGYVAFLQMDSIAQLDLFPGFLYLPPALISLLIYWIIRHKSKLRSAWWWSALAISGLAAAIDIMAALNADLQPGNMALTFLVWAAVLGLFAAVESPYMWWWSGALLMAYASYTAASAIDAVTALNVHLGYVHLIPAIVLLSIDLAVRRLLDAEEGWAAPPRLLGAFAGLVAGALTISRAGNEPLMGSIIFVIFAIYFAAYAILDKRQWLTYLSTGAGGLAFIFFLMSRGRPEPGWAVLFTFLATGYYLVGLVLALPPLREDFALSKPLQLSGLVLGSLASLVAFFEGGYASVLGVALAATCMTIEAFRRRNVWLGYPASFLYLLSYFLVLRELRVEEPQFFAIGAALLGLIMHYLLVRNQSRGAAFATGLISQLVLQSTSYIQMVATQDLKFFIALFFESLAVMTYGMVIRSRSLLFIPIGFLILGTTTVAFTVLKGISTAAIIGVTGVVLLLLGISALLMRERLARWVEILNTWQP